MPDAKVYDLFRSSGGRDDSVEVESEASQLKEKRYRQRERYQIMTDIRNDLRTLTEKYEFLSGLTDGDYIPEMSLAEVYDEDVSFHARMLLRMEQKDGKDKIFQGFQYLRENEPLQLSREKMESTQHARYIGAKMYSLIQEKDYVGARELYDDARQKLKKKNEVKALDDVCTLYLIDGIGLCFENGNYAQIVDVIMEFGEVEMLKLRRSDFADYLNKFLQDRGFIEAVAGRVAYFMSCRQDYAQEVRDLFTKLGFLKTPLSKHTRKVVSPGAPDEEGGWTIDN